MVSSECSPALSPLSPAFSIRTDETVTREPETSMASFTIPRKNERRIVPSEKSASKASEEVSWTKISSISKGERTRLRLSSDWFAPNSQWEIATGER
jgi:hypothetical protein